MSFPNSMQNGGTVAIVAGSFAGATTPAVQSGHGFSVSYSGTNFTIIFNRQYDGVISIVASVLNSGHAAAEPCIAVIKSHSVTADTNGGNFVLNILNDAGLTMGPSNFEAGTEVHFIAILKEDT